MHFEEIPVERIAATFNSTERTFKKEAAVLLAADIKTRGLLNPITVRLLGDKNSMYEVVAGRHRLWAMKRELGWKVIPCTVHDMDERGATLASFAENIIQCKLNPAQQAQGLKLLMDEQELKDGTADPATRKKRQKEFNKKIAKLLDQSVSTVRREKWVAAKFDNDQLEVLDVVQATKRDLRALASIQNPEQRAHAVNLFASGLDLLFACRQATDNPNFQLPQGEKDRVPKQPEPKPAQPEPTISIPISSAKVDTLPGYDGDDQADADDEYTDELPEVQATDDVWFQSYCSDLTNLLNDATKYKSDAVLYRNLSDKIAEFRGIISRYLSANPVVPNHRGPFFWLLDTFVRLSHPRYWVACGECGGQGARRLIDSTGNAVTVGNCGCCRGAGFRLSKES